MASDCGEGVDRLDRTRSVAYGRRRAADLVRGRVNSGPLRSVCPQCSRIIRAGRSVSFGEDLVDLVMTPCSQETESPGIPGRFKQLVA
jgi:hypothetical protein